MKKPEFRAGQKAQVRLNTQCRVIDEDKRIVEFIGSTERVDRYGTSLRGWDLTEYKKNPVFLYGHDYYFPPIGAAKRVWRDKEKNLLFRIAYVPGDLFPFAEFIFQMVKGKWLRATSVGFIPGDVKYPDRDSEESAVLLLDNELLELSQVTVPANPDALANGVRSLKASDEYLSLLSVNAKLSEHTQIDGQDTDSVRSAVLAWADEVGWNGEVEDESVVRIQVPADVEGVVEETVEAEATVPDTIPAVTESVPTESEAVPTEVESVATDPESVVTEVAEAADEERAVESSDVEETEVSAEADAEVADETVADEDDTVVTEAVASETTEEEAVSEETPAEAAGDTETDSEERATPDAPSFRASWESISGGMAQLLMGDYEDDDPAGDFARLVAGYKEHEKPLPSMIVGDREVPVTDIDPASLTDGSAVDFVFYNGEDEVWKTKRSAILGTPDETAATDASLSGDDLTVAAQGAPDIRTPPSFGGGGGVGAGPRSAPVFSRSKPVDTAGQSIRDGLKALEAELASEMDDIRDAVADEDLHAALAEFEAAEEAGFEVTSVTVSSTTGDAVIESVTTTTEDPASRSPAETPPVGAVTVDEIADMIRTSVQSALSEESVRMTDLADLATTLGVPLWFDFKGEGRTCADYVNALVCAAEENRAAPLAGNDLSQVLSKLDGISAAVGASPVSGGGMAEIGRALAARRSISDEMLSAELSVAAEAIERKVSGGARTAPTSLAPHKKKRANNYW